MAPSVRVTSLGSVHIVHQLEVPDFEQAKAECAAFMRLAERRGSACSLMMCDRLLPLATPDVRAVYRHTVLYGPPITAWAGVVGGAMGMAGSIATRIAAQIFAQRTVPMRVFRTVPEAASWLTATCETHAGADEIIRAAMELRGR